MDATRREAERFASTLTEEERMLVILKQELYEGNWTEMVEDLQARLGGRPYIFKLAHRIEDDLSRIQRLRDFERTQGVYLGHYLDWEP